MALFEQIKKDMIYRYTLGQTDISSTLKVLIADIQRDLAKDYSDDKAIAVINKRRGR